MGYAQLAIGPAGSGKAEQCMLLILMHVVNLDPAAEIFNYPVAMDIRELISLEDVMEELGRGPNDGLMYCMEYLEDSLHDWVDEELENYRDDDYLIFDCPGQIELFTHVSVLKLCGAFEAEELQRLCCLSTWFTDVTKFTSGCMLSLSAMIRLELPHVNILSKMDLLQDKSNIDGYLDPEPRTLLAELNQRMSPKFAKLNKALIEMVAEYGMVNFIPLDLRKEGSIQYVVSQNDICIQFGEDNDLKIIDEDEDFGDDGHDL